MTDQNEWDQVPAWKAFFFFVVLSVSMGVIGAYLLNGGRPLIPLFTEKSIHGGDR